MERRATRNYNDTPIARIAEAARIGGVARHGACLSVRMGELAFRFAMGGAIVTAFAVVGELFRPKTFAGLFGAAPSVAIVSVAMAHVQHGAGYVAIESRWMTAGCAALLVYGATCIAMTKRPGLPLWLGATLAWGAWAAVALGAWAALLAGVPPR